MTRSMSMWDGRTEWTPPEDVVEFVAAMRPGSWTGGSGRLLRVGADDLDLIRGLQPQDDARRLRLRPYGEGDPLGLIRRVGAVASAVGDQRVPIRSRARPSGDAGSGRTGGRPGPRRHRRPDGSPPSRSTCVPAASGSSTMTSRWHSAGAAGGSGRQVGGRCPAARWNARPEVRSFGATTTKSSLS